MSVFYFIHFGIYGQSKSELQEKKQRTEKEIEYANKLLQQTTQKKKSGYNQLLIINKKIDIQEDLIITISQEIESLINEITVVQDTVFIIEEELKNLKNEYAELIKESFKKRNRYNDLIYIFSSKDFNQAYKRLKYLQQFDLYKESKAKEIENTKIRLTKQLENLSLLKAEKNSLLIESENEINLLNESKSNQANLVNRLKKKEKDIRAEIEDKKKQAKQIEKEIKRIIEEELRRAEELARKNNTKDILLSLTPEEKLISENFEENRSRLPWPTERGIITSKFGIQPHPVLKGVTIENNGIDISTTEGAYARAIFKGKVTAISYIVGINNIVLIKHGSYYTVYTNLIDVMVNVNDIVNDKQIIGKIYTNKENDTKTYLNFQIWKGREKLDPGNWIAH